MTIGVISVGIGNIGSLRHAFDAQGWDTVSVSSPEALDDLTHLVLPGVGAFPAAMSRLENAGLVEPLREFARSGRPLAGICLGMQLLGSLGTEDDARAGLGLIEGTIRRIPQIDGLRLPHVGWNEVRLHRSHPVLERVRNKADCYFVHSYRFEVASNQAVIGTTDYGEGFVSIVGKDNVIGLQFHPEKSQFYGLRMLDNFCMWDGKC